MPKFTPGPWMVDVWDYPQSTPPRKELNIKTADNLLATLQCDYTGSNHYIVPQEQAEANARLIAAAPELLEILQAIVSQYDRTPSAMYVCEDAIDAARVVIAKAAQS